MISRSQMNRQLYQMGGEGMQAGMQAGMQGNMQEGIMQMAPQEMQQMDAEQYRPVAEQLAQDPNQALMAIVRMLMEQGIPEEEAIKIAKQMIQAVAEGGMEELSDDTRIEARFGGRIGYAEGGIGRLVNREQYGFGSIFKGVTKAVTGVVKGATKAVKSVAKSPIGRIALTIAAVYALGPAGLNVGAGMSPFAAGALKAGIANLGVQAVSGQGINFKEALLAAGLGGVTGSLTTGQTGEATKFAPDPFQEAALGNPTVSSFEPSAFAPDPFQAAAAPAADTYANIAGGAADIGGEAAYTSAFDYQNTPSLFDTSAQASITGGPGTGIPASDFSDYLNKGIDYPVYDPTDLGSGVVGIEPTLGKFGQTTGLRLDNPELAGFTNVEGGSPMNILGPGGRVETFKEALGQGNYLDALKQVSGAAMDYPLTTIGGISTLASAMTPEIPEQLPGESMEEYRARVAEFERQYASNLSGRTGPSLPASANNPFYPVYAARGGRIGYQEGSMPMGEPRRNPAGIMELDYRNEGGFVPPIGIKERADDIPAMLSNNEFVFTADAVKNAGGGDPNIGAQKMYTLMKRLESGGRV
jgi:hypothetical protein